jgi:hypothetical protein
MTGGLRAVLREVRHGETSLERELHAVAARHRTDHEVRHTAIDLARWSLMNREALAPWFGDEQVEPEEGSAVLRVVREKASELMGREPPAALLLLHDLRHLYLRASGNAVLWTMVLQAARSSQQTELADAAFLSLARTQRQVTWCKSTIKVLSPQALAAV